MRKTSVVTALMALLALVVLAGPAAAAWGMPDALTPRGQQVQHLYEIITVLGVIVFLIVFALMVTIVVRFRETTGHGRSTHEKERHNSKLEALWIGVPLVMVLWIGYAAYGGMTTLERGVPIDQADLEIKIIGSQWNWRADYGNGVGLNADPNGASGAVADDHVFLVPAGKNVLLNITGTDVIHAFNILDGNRAWFSMNDANPLGSNKYALQVLNFPAGNYSVQCKEMCLNPGHAYMRARITAVPQADFDHWVAGKRAAITPPTFVAQSLSLSAAGGQLRTAEGKPIGNLTLAAQTHVVVELQTPAQDVTLTATGSPAKTIRAGERTDNFYGFDIERAGAYTLSASTGGSIRITAINATAVEVDLGVKDGFKFDPEHVTLKVGVTYLITVPNKHTATHDLHIGHYHGGQGDEVVASSPSVGGGDTGAFLVTPTQAGEFDMWCSQPGHVGLGMRGTATIST